MIQHAAVIGLQDGDEGKGKITDWLISRVLEEDVSPILVQRYQGGANAGHTHKVTFGNEEINVALHQIPAGVIFDPTQVHSLMGKQMYIRPDKLVEEMAKARQAGVDISPKNLSISSQAHITLDYHIHDDLSFFNKAEHSSTGNGIKQTAVDKFNRVGLRFVEFLDEAFLVEYFTQRFDAAVAADLVDKCGPLREALAPYVANETEVLSRGWSAMVSEGAQGFGLDIDEGKYPGITSSNPAYPTHRPSNLIGVLKAYKSSVGIENRPFVTEMPEEYVRSLHLHEAWSEKGTTTGRERHIGWFDAVDAKYAIDSTGVEHLVLTCIDRMEVFAQHGLGVKLCVGYEIDGITYTSWDVSFDHRNTLWNAIPVYETLEPWEKAVHNGTLTPEAERYVNAIEDFVKQKVKLVSHGPGHNDVLELT